jgi:ABC-type transport system involved in multi-copper enzyme maturation permease subunit
MGKFGGFEITLIIIVLAGLSIMILAVYKLVGSSISNWNKVAWILTFILFNVIAGIVFILFHDYFLSPTKRAHQST